MVGKWEEYSDPLIESESTTREDWQRYNGQQTRARLQDDVKGATFWCWVHLVDEALVRGGSAGCRS